MSITTTFPNSLATLQVDASQAGASYSIGVTLVDNEITKVRLQACGALGFRDVPRTRGLRDLNGRHATDLYATDG